MHKVIEGDCREVMAGMDASSVDAIVTDPPYGLSFMGKGWDKGVPGVEFWVEALRVAKPGTHLLAFGGTRMVHRLAVAIEDAGWEIRDRIHWVYGSGFPKSHDVSKAIDKAAGAEREVVGMSAHKPGIANKTKGHRTVGGTVAQRVQITTPATPATPAARQWHGWGTALKPAVEPIILARKPFKGTVAANVLEWGTGAINVDGCRAGEEGGTRRDGKADTPNSVGWENMRGHGIATIDAGRWPANLIHDGSDDATAGMGDASRYFYCAKASKKDRDAGVDRDPVVAGGMIGRRDGSMGKVTYSKNHHPTVKPTNLMAYLCRLITPPGGTVLDPFNGSGSTGVAAIREGFNYIGIELDPAYADIAKQRIAHEVASNDDLAVIPTLFD